MASSDEVRLSRAGRMRLVLMVVATAVLGVIVVVALVIGGFWFSIWKHQENIRARNVDVVEETFLGNRAGFEATAAYISQLALAEPDAIRVGWTPAWICVIDTSLEKTCHDGTDAERELRGEAPRATLIQWQTKDDGRVFFSFPEDEAPTNNLMFDPQERDAKEFAKEHGFSWERDLGDGWSIPGHIPDDDDFDAMWVTRWS